MTRTPGLRGRLPVRAPDDRYAIKYLHEYVALPAPVYPIDMSGGITDFGMLGNDQAGDCGEAGIRHVEMTTAARAKAPVPTFTTAEALAEYRAYTGGPDTGVVLADFLMWLYKKGRILAFAPVDHTNRKAVDSALRAFGGLYCGVSLTDDADQRFSEHKPWVAGQPDPREGHCIEKVGATSTHDTWVTWGALQGSTAGWTTGCLDEVWAVITTEDSALSPDELATLRADIDAAGGTGGTSTEIATEGATVKASVNLPLVVSIITALAGAAGTVLVPVLGQNLATAVQAILQAVVGLLVLIPSYHVSNVAATTYKARSMARLNAEFEGTPKAS